MIFSFKNTRVKIIFLLTALISQTALADQPVGSTATSSNKYLLDRPIKVLPKRASLFFQIGQFTGLEGNAQNVGIQGLVGDYFSVNNRQYYGTLFGLGLFMDEFDRNKFSLLYGLNAFYLKSHTVQGDVIQEQTFTNLSYSYNIANFPIYAAVKALVDIPIKNCTFTLDLGVGPNIIRTSEFQENSLDGGVTVPDYAFSGKTSVAFSATAGFGIRINNAIGYMPLELSYRFFYLGQGQLHTVNSQITSTLYTGQATAEALMLSVAF